MSQHQRYRLRSRSDRELIREVEPGTVYVDRETGEEFEIVGKVLPLAPSASDLPWAVENLRLCGCSLEQLAPDQVEETDVSRDSRPRSVTFAVRLDPKTIELLRRIAKLRQVGATQLVRSWVLERLRLERSAGALAKTTSGFPREFEVTVRQRILDALMDHIPEAVEEAMQEVLDRADQETAALREG